MTRHITDNRPSPDSSKRAAVLMKQNKQQLRKDARGKLLEHAHGSSNGRLVQYLKIERGRVV